MLGYFHFEAKIFVSKKVLKLSVPKKVLKLDVLGDVKILCVPREVRTLIIGKVLKLVVAKVFLVSESSLLVCLRRVDIAQVV